MAPGEPRPSRQSLPVVRVRHPCPTLAEFRARYARGIALEGLFALGAKPRPLGTRVDLAIELRDGTRIRGEAITVGASSPEEGRPGSTYRFVQLLEGSLEYDEPAPLAPPQRADPFAPPPAPAAAPGSLEGVLAPERKPALPDDAGAVYEPITGPEPEVTIEVPLRDDVLETRSAMDAEKQARRAGTRRGRVRSALAAGGAVVVVALSAYLVASSGPHRDLEREIRLADERFADGRLAGDGDAALDHLVAARSIRAGDPRVRERLRMLADKLEELAESALARGDYAEAAVHLTSASQAEPDRKSVHMRLGEIARRRGAPSREQGVTGTRP